MESDRGDLAVVVDPEGLIAESDKSNNTYIGNIHAKKIMAICEWFL